MIRRVAMIVAGLLLTAAPALAQPASAAPSQVDLSIQGVGNVSAPLQVVLLLTLLGWLPGVIHAFFVVSDYKNEKRLRAIAESLKS